MKKNKNRLDLSVKYPKYFKKFVFRTAFFIIFVLCVKVAVFEIQNNPTPFNYVYVSCGEDEALCVNPLYLCQYPAQDDCVSASDMPAGVCELGYCSAKYLGGGVSYGIKPPFLLRHALSIVSLILIFGFLVNHILYKVKK